MDGASGIYEDTVLVWAHNLGIGDFVDAIPLFRFLAIHTKQLHLSSDETYYSLIENDNVFGNTVGEFSKPPLDEYDLLIEIVSHPSKLKRSLVRSKRKISLSTVDEYNEKYPVYRILQDQFRDAGYIISDTHPALNIPCEHKAWANLVLTEHGIDNKDDSLWVGIHAGAGFIPKLWPVSRFAGLADRMQEMYEAKILILGGPADQIITDEMIRLMKHPPAFIAQNYSIGEIAALISCMDIFISCDSGLMHVANALKIPLVAIFGPTQPRTWGPTHECSYIVYAPPKSCGSCGYTIAGQCHHRDCLRNITVETVLVHVERLLDKVARRRRGPAERFVWNDNPLEWNASHELYGRLMACPDSIATCETKGPAVLQEFAAALEPVASKLDLNPNGLVDVLRESRILAPFWYSKVQQCRRARMVSTPVGKREIKTRRRLTFAIARETDASEMLTLLSHLPDAWDVSVMVSRRHPLMGTLLSRYDIPYVSYADTDDFYRQTAEFRPDAIVWASYANIDRYEPGYRHVFVDHGMHSKGHFMSGLQMGPYDLNDFALMCMPNRFTYDRMKDLGYEGQLELTGYLKGDIYFSRKPCPRIEILEGLHLDPARPTAVYCPTNMEWIGTGTLKQYYRWVLQAAHLAEVNLLIRPHEEDYVHRPWILERIHRDCHPGQVIVLDWDSPLWLNVADVFVGDASSANIEAIMAQTPTVLLPAAPARSVDGSDVTVADLHQEMVHKAVTTATSAEHLAELLRRPPAPEPNLSLVQYFNEYFDGQVYSRFYSALDRIRM